MLGWIQAAMQQNTIAKGSVLVLYTKFNYRLGLVDMLVTLAITRGFGLTSLSGVLRGFMPPQLKTKYKKARIFHTCY